MRRRRTEIEKRKERRGGARNGSGEEASAKSGRGRARRNFFVNFVGGRNLGDERRREERERQRLEVLWELRMRGRRRSGTTAPLNRERGSWASNRWAAAVRFVGRHVAQCYTRGKQKATGWPHGSGTAVRIRCGAINASAEVEGKRPLTLSCQAQCACH